MKVKIKMNKAGNIELSGLHGAVLQSILTHASVSFYKDLEIEKAKKGRYEDYIRKMIATIDATSEELTRANNRVF